LEIPVDVQFEKAYRPGRTIRIGRGDITAEKVDAIVNAANSQLAHGGGVAGAIVKNGGPIIQEESNRIAPVPVGGAAVTGAGALPARFVIHAVGPRWGEGDEARKLAEAIREALSLADQKKCKTLSLPAVSSGIFGFPKDRCAEIILNTIEAFYDDHPDTSLVEVNCCNFDDETVACFLEDARKRYPRG
jgi:O-acetyl-ADP-ribose deacetylase (regulator of RNase III)